MCIRDRHDTDKFGSTRPDVDRMRQARLKRTSEQARMPHLAAHRRQNKLLKADHAGDRIAREAEDKMAPDRTTERDRVARAHVHAPEVHRDAQGFQRRTHMIMHLSLIHI